MAKIPFQVRMPLPILMKGALVCRECISFAYSFRRDPLHLSDLMGWTRLDQVS